MHNSSLKGMQQNIAAYLGKATPGTMVLDVGAMDVNGTYRALFNSKIFKYMGTDLAAGPNVDLVMKSEFEIPLPDDSVDVVISGQCFEHCRNPFRLAVEMFRVCKPGGLCLVVAPREWKEHRHPWDCFRYLADGMRSILETAGFVVEKAFVIGIDCWGIGKKAKAAK